MAATMVSCVEASSGGRVRQEGGGIAGPWRIQGGKDVVSSSSSLSLLAFLAACAAARRCQPSSILPLWKRQRGFGSHVRSGRAAVTHHSARGTPSANECRLGAERR